MCRQACVSILAHFSDSISEEKLISQASIKNKNPVSFYSFSFKMYKLQSMIHSLHELICPDSRFGGDKDFQASFWSGSRAVYITACSSA